MSSRRWWFVLATAGLIGACSGPKDATGPNSSPSVSLALVMRADGPEEVAGQPGETLADFPRVQVVMSSSGVPVAGVAVTFSVWSNGTSRTVVTDAKGIAHFGEFTFGAQSGPDQVSAVAGQIPSLRFTAYVRSKVVSRYDLQSVGGRSLPQTLWYSGGWRQAVGGHYVLMADGTFYYFYYSADDSLPLEPQGRYTSSANTIDFYLTGGWFLSSGSIGGDAMHVSYGYSEDDHEAEDYARR